MTDHPRPTSPKSYDPENTHCRATSYFGTSVPKRCGEPVSSPGALYCEACGGPPADDSGPRGAVRDPSSRSPHIKSPGGHPTELARAEAAAQPIPSAGYCRDWEHEQQLQKLGIDTTTSLCLLCALEAVTTDESGAVHEHSEAIFAWAYEFASQGREDAGMLANLAVNAPGAFLRHWHRGQARFFRDELRCRSHSGRAAIHPITPRQELEVVLCDLERLIQGTATERDRGLPDIRRAVRAVIEGMDS